MTKRVEKVLGKVKSTVPVVVAYRIKHIPTGFFFIPSRSVKVTQGPDWTYVKSNLSVKGKAYIRRPSLLHLGDTYYSHLVLKWVQAWPNRKIAHDQLLPVILGEWEIQPI
jgi:hypothetical protein